MTIEEKTKRERMFCKMTQVQLKKTDSYGEDDQDRIAYYDCSSRDLQTKLFDRMAEVMDMNRYFLCNLTEQNNSEFIQLVL